MQGYPVPQMKDEREDYLRQTGFVFPSSRLSAMQHNATAFNPLTNGLGTFAPPNFDRELDMEPNDRDYPRYGETGDF